MARHVIGRELFGLTPGKGRGRQILWYELLDVDPPAPTDELRPGG